MELREMKMVLGNVECMKRELNVKNEGVGGIVVRKRGDDVKMLRREFGDCLIIDVTHFSEDDEWRKLSPEFIHYGIPVPYSEGVYGSSVEGIWEGLKEMEGVGIDRSKLKLREMKGFVRMMEVEEKKNGRWVRVKKRCGEDMVLGIRKGVDGKELLSVDEGWEKVYVKCYNWVLRHKVYDKMKMLRIVSKKKIVVLLDLVGKESWNGKGRVGNGYLMKKFVEEKM